MSDSDAVDEIREQKREELLDQTGSDDEGTRAPDEPVHVESEDHFTELTGDGVVLADFYADWCAPCRQLAPIVERVAGATSATVAKVDVDHHQGLAQQYGVRGVPTMVLFSDGEAVERVVGVRGESELTDLVESYA
jgi:thioredoxin